LQRHGNAQRREPRQVRIVDELQMRDAVEALRSCGACGAECIQRFADRRVADRVDMDVEAVGIGAFDERHHGIRREVQLALVGAGTAVRVVVRREQGGGLSREFEHAVGE
jgi:hypothetical protein